MRARLLSGAIVGLLGVGSAGPLDAGQRVVAQIVPDPALSRFTDRQPPTRVARRFSKLFQPAPAPKPGGPATAESKLPPRVACGMTLVPVDPRFDAAIRRQAPSRPQPSVRAETPPRCQD